MHIQKLGDKHGRVKEVLKKYVCFQEWSKAPPNPFPMCPYWIVPPSLEIVTMSQVYTLLEENFRELVVMITHGSTGHPFHSP